MTNQIATELDGTYQVTTMSDYAGPLQKKSDGQTTIKDGQTHRIDDAGCEWSSTFEWANDDKTLVTMTSIADPLNADADFLLTRPDGSPTSDKVTYQSELKVMRKGDCIQMTGTINYGADTTIITMRKIDAV